MTTAAAKSWARREIDVALSNFEAGALAVIDDPKATLAERDLARASLQVVLAFRAWLAEEDPQ